jgi:hypothetical protein
MSNAIPFFYTDLIARMIPGAFFLALVSLMPLELPGRWSTFMAQNSTAHAVVIPLVYAAIIYAIGTVIETALGPFLERIYICAFRSASMEYSWTSLNGNDRPCRPAKDLSRATIGNITIFSENEKNAVAQIFRFHSEAKMCWSISLILFAFAVFVSLPYNLFECKPSFIYKSLIIFSAISLVWITWERLKSRARMVFRMTDRLGEKQESDSYIKLRYELMALSQKSWMKCSVWKRLKCFVKQSHRVC